MRNKIRMTPMARVIANQLRTQLNKCPKDNGGHRDIPAGLRHQAVTLARESDASVDTIGKAIGVHPTLLRRWVSETKRDEEAKHKEVLKEEYKEALKEEYLAWEGKSPVMGSNGHNKAKLPGFRQDVSVVLAAFDLELVDAEAALTAIRKALAKGDPT